MVHGGIDGYSRLIVYLQCSTNNRASTVASLFFSAVHTFGLPSRVWSDKGGENVDVAWLILTNPLRGPGRGSMIAGRSVHNQRKERLWRDLYTGCTHLFYQLFYHMEESLILDPSNEVQLFALHYVTFTSGHNNGPISTERNLTPLQLWVNGLAQQSRLGQANRVMEEFNNRVMS